MSEQGAAGLDAVLATGPYKGLAPFDDSDLDALLFFGRERERDLVLANLAAASLTVLYGASGVGKSSLLRAGVAHHLRTRRKPTDPEIAVVVYGSWAGDPLPGLRAEVAAEARRLGGAAASGFGDRSPLADLLKGVTDALDGEFFLILDQLEEYFLYHGEATGPGTLGNELAEILARSNLPVSVLLSIREDELAALDGLKSRVPNLFANPLRLEHLDRAAGRAATLGPLDRWNELAGLEEPVTAEEALVEAVLDEVAAGRIDPGLAGRGAVERGKGRPRVEAPYLQLVLQRVWEVERASGSRRLRLATLRELGGAQRIVEEHLELALGALSAGQQELAAAMFDHLVTPSGTKIAHELGDLAVYASAPADEVEPVVRSLAGDRILRPLGNGRGGHRFEIYHDVLAAAVLAWRNRHGAGRELERERRAAHARHRRLLVVAAASLVGVIGLTAVTVFALRERSRSEERANVAEARELAATAFAQLAVDPELSLALALEAARLEQSPRIEEALRRSLVESRVRSMLRPPGAGRLLAAALLPGEREIATIDEGGRLSVLTRGRQGAARWISLGAELRSASFGPDGRLVLALGADGGVRLLRVATGAPLPGFGQPRRVALAALAPGGRFLATVDEAGVVRVSAVPSGERVGSFVLKRPSTSIGVSADGSLVATAERQESGEGERLIEIRTSSGGQVRALPSAIGRIRALTFDAAGDRLAAGTSGGVAQVWHARSGRFVARMIGHMNFVTSVAFSDDGALLVTASRDRTARVWDAATGRQLAVLRGHRDSVGGISLDGLGNLVITAGADGTVRVWDARGEPGLKLVHRFDGPVTGAVAGPGGEIVAVEGSRIVVLDSAGRERASLRRDDRVAAVSLGPSGEVVAAADSSAIIWRPRSSEVIEVRQPGPVNAAVLAPSGLVLTGGPSGEARLTRRDGTLVRVLEQGEAVVHDVGFDASGGRIVTASADGLGRIWTQRGRLLRVLEGHEGAVTSASFSSDGRLVITASADHDARIWHARTGRLLQVLRGHFGPVNDVSFSADGRWAVTAGPVSAALWDVSSGEILFYLRGHEGRVRSASFIPRTSRVVTASEDGTLRTYACDVCGRVEVLVRLAERRLASTGRTLTAAERRRFLPEEG